MGNIGQSAAHIPGRNRIPLVVCPSAARSSLPCPGPRSVSTRKNIQKLSHLTDSRSFSKKHLVTPNYFRVSHFATPTAHDSTLPIEHSFACCSAGSARVGAYNKNPNTYRPPVNTRIKASSHLMALAGTNFCIRAPAYMPIIPPTPIRMPRSQSGATAMCG